MCDEFVVLCRRLCVIAIGKRLLGILGEEVFFASDVDEILEGAEDALVATTLLELVATALLELVAATLLELVAAAELAGGVLLLSLLPPQATMVKTIALISNNFFIS